MEPFYGEADRISAANKKKMKKKFHFRSLPVFYDIYQGRKIRKKDLFHIHLKTDNSLFDERSPFLFKLTFREAKSE